jgi:hypothetical protein
VEDQYRHNGRGVHVSPAGVGVSRKPGARAATKVVACPHNSRDRILVGVNNQVDHLEREYACGHIEAAHYAIGRQIEALFYRQAERWPSSWHLGHRSDPFVAKELGIIKGIDRARAKQLLIDKLERKVGTIGRRFLERMLLQGVSYADEAANRGWSRGVSGTKAVAKMLRSMLEDLSKTWNVIEA